MATEPTVQQLAAMEPWQWPENIGKTLLDALSQRDVPEADLLVAAVLAGDPTIIDDALASRLLSIAGDALYSEELRCRAAISLGPVLEEGDTFDFDDGHSAITEATFTRLVSTLRTLYGQDIPDGVRRCVLEAAVRAPQDRHPDAVRAAWASSETAWQRTAVFCMRFVPGFDKPILAALDSDDEVVFYQAVLAAGATGLQAAWPAMLELLHRKEADKSLLLAAIDTVACLRPKEAPSLLAPLLAEGDEDVVDAIHEALSLVSSDSDDEDGFLEDDVLADVEPGPAFLVGPPPWIPPGQTQAVATAISQKVGRNEPCPCGSSKKYKKCCGN